MQSAPFTFAALTFGLAVSSFGPPASAQTYALAPADADASVLYRFRVMEERPSGGPGGRGDPGDGGRTRPPGTDGQNVPPGGDGRNAPGGSRIDERAETIRFTILDATHVRLTMIDPASTDTVVAEIGADGELHAKLNRHSEWAEPLSLYDRIAQLSFGPAATLDEGMPSPLALRPLAGTDAVAGAVVRTHASGATFFTYDGQGSVKPSDDFWPHGGGSGGGMGGDRPDFSHADATVHVVARFEGGRLVRADSTESLHVKATDFAAEQESSIERL